MKRFVILTALTAALAAQAASAQISFQAAQSVPAGAQPDATALADLDGDGDLDMAVSTDAPDKVSLLFNNGGNFGAPVNVLLAGGSGPDTPVAGDLDGDGDVDLAVSLHNTGAVRLVVNNGGAFSAGASIAVGSDPRDLELADLDNDGDWDLVSSNRSSNTVSVLRNLGALAFAVTSFAAGNDPREIALGDFTGDKLCDIAIASHDDRAVTVLRNLGAGQFTTFATLSLGQLRPEGMDAGDVDGTGSMDIVAAASNNGVEFASVLLNVGGGGFAAPANYALLGLDSGSLVLSDLDQDGALDVAAANQSSNNVSTLRNLGAGTFGPASLWGVGASPNDVVAGDLDGNGAPDLVTANDSAADVSILENLASGTACSTSVYCTAKVNSLGQAAQIHAAGVPSLGAGGFSIQMSGSVPGNVTIAFFSNLGQASIPFMNGFVCVAPPTTRLSPQVISAAGTAAYAIAVTPALSGTQRWYQFWYRDPAHPDGTGTALSNGLQVTFCD